MVSETEATAIRTLPKAELHLHIEGTLEPELALEFAERNHVSLPWNSLEELKQQYQFENLQSFLNLYYTLMGTLKTEEDFHDLALAYLKHAHSDGVRHAEIFFDPQVHCNNGIAFETVLHGLLAGIRDGYDRYQIDAGLIMSIVRDLPVESAIELMQAATPYADQLLGIGLDSAEIGNPPELFVPVFDQARDLGLHAVAHAGEEGPVEYIRQALDLLHVERIDHGTHAIDDPQMVLRLAQQAIPITSCPLSNFRLHVVQSVADLPMRTFLEQGMIVTINSDDPAYFGGYVAANYDALADGMQFMLDDMAQLAQNSFVASFIDENQRRSYLDEIDSWRETYLA